MIRPHGTGNSEGLFAGWSGYLGKYAADSRLSVCQPETRRGVERVFESHLILHPSIFRIIFIFGD